MADSAYPVHVDLSVGETRVIYLSVGDGNGGTIPNAVPYTVVASEPAFEAAVTAYGSNPGIVAWPAGQKAWVSVPGVSEGTYTLDEQSGGGGPVQTIELPVGWVRPLALRDEPGAVLLPTWTNGVQTTGDPRLIDWDTETGTALLRFEGNGTAGRSGVIQVLKGAQATGYWGAYIEAVKPDAVCALFLYAQNSANDKEIDFELTRDPQSVPLWSMALHLPGGVYTPVGAQTSVPWQPGIHKHEIYFDATILLLWIDGVEVYRVTPDSMPSQYTWDALTKVEMFFSVESHGSWANQTYTDGTASMRVHGLHISPNPPDGLLDGLNTAPQFSGDAAVNGGLFVGASLTVVPPAVSGFPAPVVEYAIQSRAAATGDWSGTTETAFVAISQPFVIPPELDGQYVRARVRATNSVGTVDAFSPQLGPIAASFTPTTLISLSPSDVTTNGNGDVTAIANNGALAVMAAPDKPDRAKIVNGMFALGGECPITLSATVDLANTRLFFVYTDPAGGWKPMLGGPEGALMSVINNGVDQVQIFFGSDQPIAFDGLTLPGGTFLFELEIYGDQVRIWINGALQATRVITAAPDQKLRYINGINPGSSGSGPAGDFILIASDGGDATETAAEGIRGTLATTYGIDIGRDPVAPVFDGQPLLDGSFSVGSLVTITPPPVSAGYPAPVLTQRLEYRASAGAAVEYYPSAEFVPLTASLTLPLIALGAQIRVAVKAENDSGQVTARSAWSGPVQAAFVPNELLRFSPDNVTESGAHVTALGNSGTNGITGAPAISERLELSGGMLRLSGDCAIVLSGPIAMNGKRLFMVIDPPTGSWNPVIGGPDGATQNLAFNDWAGMTIFMGEDQPLDFTSFSMPAARFIFEVEFLGQQVRLWVNGVLIQMQSHSLAPDWTLAYVGGASAGQSINTTIGDTVVISSDGGTATEDAASDIRASLAATFSVVLP